MLHLFFHGGTLILKGAEKSLPALKPFVVFDPRIGHHRGKASAYADIVKTCHNAQIPLTDHAKNYALLALKTPADFVPRLHQEQALEAWMNQGSKGVVVLPTGSGKTYLALQVMEKIQRSTLIVVPTLDLMQQWASQIERHFQCHVGLLGGGSKDISEITVSTYDSAVLMMEFIGNRFGLVIFDECHHLPSEKNSLAATLCLAPYRLGLTATPERPDQGEQRLYELLGNLCFRKDIDEMEGDILSPYSVTRLEIPMSKVEKQDYEFNREIYLSFVRKWGISFQNPKGWTHFISTCSRESGGKEAFAAYLTQKKIASSSQEKLNMIWEILKKHAGEKILIFTAENKTAYTLGRHFFLPVITHQTKVAERKTFLDAFRKGAFPVLVTSKVLNEGIDVPEASVGIIVSGSGSIREHVQRLGRILRRVEGKQARLYELVSEGTSEIFVSVRRSQHRAYQRSHKMQTP